MFYNQSLINNSTLGGLPVTSLDRNLSTHSSFNIDPPPPPHFPFFGPTQAVTNFAKELLASINITEFIQAVKDRIRTFSFPTESELFPVIDKNWFIQPRNIGGQDLVVYPVFESFEALLLQIQASYGRIILNSDFESFLKNHPLNGEQQKDLFWKLLTKRPRNLNVLIELFLAQYPDFDLNILIDTRSTPISPLQRLVICEHLETLQFLAGLESINPNLRGNESDGTALHLAAEGNYVEAISALLQHPAIDLNSVRQDGATPLFCAFINEKIEAFKLILSDIRANINIVNSDGNGMLHLFPVLENWELILNLLLEKNELDFNILNKLRQTPLIVLCQDTTDTTVSLRILLKLFRAKDSLYIQESEFRASSINVNAQDIKGNTALHAACENLSILILINLIRHPEIDLALKNKDGKIPLQILVENYMERQFYTGVINEHLARFILTFKKIKFPTKPKENEFVSKIKRLFQLDDSIKNLDDLEEKMRAIIVQSVTQGKGNILQLLIKRGVSGK